MLCILERMEILPKEEAIIKLGWVGAVGIFDSIRETTNPKPILFVTLVLAFDLVVICRSFGVGVF